MSVCTPSSSNPVMWREGLRKGTFRVTVLTLVNIVGAGVVIAFLRDRLTLNNDGLLPAWAWWSLAALMAGTAYGSYVRVRRERICGTLELLRSTPMVPHALLEAQVQLSLRWMARAVPLWALWLVWALSTGLRGGALHLLVIVPFGLLVAMAGALLGVRLALAPQGSTWSVLGGTLGLASVIAIPALIDATTTYVAEGMPVGADPTGWMLLAEGCTLLFLLVGVSWLWSANLRLLSGFETVNQAAQRSAKVAPLWQLFDHSLQAGARLFNLQRNPFFMREKTRALRRVSREPGWVLTAIVPTVLPYVVARGLNLTLGASLAWCSIPLIFVWWMAGAEMTRNSMTNELDSRTLDSVRVSPLPIDAVLLGTVLGRMVPFGIGWLVSLPLWAWYAVQPGISALSICTFALVLLAVGLASAVGGLRGSCTSLGLKGEERHFSQAVLNPALWAWPVFTPLADLFIVMPLHPLLQTLHVAGSGNTWVPLDVVSLFPTWFVLPGLLPSVTFLLGVLLHMAILAAATRADLAAAWKAVYKVMSEDLPESRMIGAIIFDWDGVLVDSEPIFKQVEQTLLLEAWETSGRPGTPDIDRRIEQVIRDMMGRGAAAALGLCRERLGLRQSLDDLMTDYRVRLRGVYGSSPLVPRALDTVRRLRPHTRLAVATSSPHELVDALLARVGLAPLLDAVVTVDDVGGVAKPAPDLYRAAAGRLEVHPADCLAIEDTPVGCTSAVAAGCRCLAIPRRDTVRAAFPNAHRVVRSLADLTLEFLEDLDKPVDPEEAGWPVALYARAVQGRGADVLVHVQTAAAEALARERGWVVAGCFHDQDEGEVWWERPGLQPLLELARQRCIRRVVTAEPSVLAAGALEQAEIVRHLAEHEVRVRCVFRQEPYAATGAWWN